MKERLVVGPQKEILKIPDNIGIVEVSVRLPDLQTATLQPLQGKVAVRPGDGDDDFTNDTIRDIWVSTVRSGELAKGRHR